MATLDLESFLAEFVEFRTTERLLCQKKLDEAHRAFSESAFGARYLDAVKYKAAHLIACSPFGRELRLAKGSKETLYSEPLQSIVDSVPAPPLVLR